MWQARKGDKTKSSKARSLSLGTDRGMKMKNAKNTMRVVGIVLLGLFVLVVGVPLLLAAAGITLSILGFVTALAIGLIKVAVVLAIGYLVLVGIRTVLR
jgi:hypothetical protein